MEKELVSLIIPVYRVEKFLDRCMESVLNQDYHNLEIILVDDGSPDSSPEICDRYAESDKRVKVIHKNNGGQSSARNAGLKISSGKYVNFLDSDDWIARDTISYAISLITKYEADAVQYDYAHVSSEEDKIDNPKENIEIQKGNTILEDYMMTVIKTGSYSMVRCFFKKSVLEGLFFREGKNSEDLDFKFKVLSRCKLIVVSNQFKYYYFQSPTSTSNGGLRKGDYDLYDAANILLDVAKKTKIPNVIKLAEVKKARTPFSLLCKLAYFGVNDSSIDKRLVVRELIKEHRINASKLLYSPIPLSRKILVLLFFMNYTLAENCIHIAKSINSNYD